MAEELAAAIARCSAAAAQRIEALLPARAGAQSDVAEPLWYHLDTGGKRLRPALCLLTCEAFGGAMELALDFAAAVELLHNTFLIHDDIEDGDEVRRDRPALWVRYGVPIALNSGDYLLGLAYGAVLRTPGGPELNNRLLRVFNQVYLQTVEGQALDLLHRADPQFTPEKYLRMVELKTGCYLALGMVGGAMIAGAGEDTVETLWQFGRCAGPAFQVRDDLLDLTPGKGRGGKIGSDIEEGKASLLYAHALSAAPPPEREQLVRIMSRPRGETTAQDVRWVIELYQRCGTLEFGRGYAVKLMAAAKALLRRLPLVEGERLTALADYLIERTT